MTQGSSFDPILVTIVLATLAIGLPIVFVLAIRFLWERQLSLGRSKDLDKLIWQMHRIASAMEHQLNVSFPAVQPGTEEARDLAYLQQVPQPAAPKAAPPTTRVAPPSAPTRVPVPVAQPAQHAVAPLAAVQQPVQQAAAPSVAVPQQPAPQAQPPTAQEPAAPAAQPTAEQPAEPEPAFNPIVPHDPAAGPPRHAGVNSMFGF
jgi:hypothetical protein